MNKDKLQHQLDEMKAKVAEMEAELNKPKKFELKYEGCDTYLLNIDKIENKYSGNIESYLEHGRYRQTKEGAELSLDRNRRANRLEALVEQVGSIKEFVIHGDNYFMYSIGNGKWTCSYSTNYFSPERVYTDGETAIKVCEILNAGEYEL